MGASQCGGTAGIWGLPLTSRPSPPIAVPLLRAPLICELSIKSLPSSDRPRVLSPAGQAAWEAGRAVGSGVRGSVEALRPRPGAAGQGRVCPGPGSSRLLCRVGGPAGRLSHQVTQNRSREDEDHVALWGEGRGRHRPSCPPRPTASAKAADRSWAVAAAASPPGRTPPVSSPVSWGRGLPAPQSHCGPHRGDHEASAEGAGTVLEAGAPRWILGATLR